TTHDEVAKKEGKFDEKKVYIEVPVVIGRGRLFEGLEAALVGAKVGETIEVLIPPEKGAGVRDPRLVELRTEREFLRQEISPEVGMEVSISGKHGVVTAVSAGRVRVDFNNPLAGKTLKYVVQATRKAEPTRTEATGEAGKDESGAVADAPKKPRKRATATKAKPAAKTRTEEELPASEKAPEEL